MHSSLSQLPQQAVGTASAPRRRLARLGGGRLCVRAGSEGSDSASQQARQVTYEQALELLKLKDGATGEQLVHAKNAAVGRGNDVALVDAAYDAVLLRSLTKRRSGTAVSLDVKYADVKVSSGKPLASNTSAKGPGSAMGSSGRGSTAAGVRGGAASSGDGSNPAASLLAALPTVRSPDASQLAPVAALFAALGLAALATGVVHTPGTPDPAPSVPLAFGFAAALFHLRRKAVSLPRAAGLTSLGLAAGTLMGVLVQSGLHVDIVPLGPLSSPATLVAESALVGMFTATALLL